MTRTAEAARAFTAASLLRIAPYSLELTNPAPGGAGFSLPDWPPFLSGYTHSASFSTPLVRGASVEIRSRASNRAARAFCGVAGARRRPRSEEHTSELQ